MSSSVHVEDYYLVPVDKEFKRRVDEIMGDLEGERLVRHVTLCQDHTNFIFKDVARAEISSPHHSTTEASVKFDSYKRSSIISKEMIPRLGLKLVNCGVIGGMTLRIDRGMHILDILYDTQIKFALSQTIMVDLLVVDSVPGADILIGSEATNKYSIWRTEESFNVHCPLETLLDREEKCCCARAKQLLREVVVKLPEQRLDRDFWRRFHSLQFWRKVAMSVLQPGL